MSEEKQKFRKIIHIDMDAFYASVEQRDNPDYRNRPIAVGGGPEGRGGVVATASYEARKFGVRSAMPSRQALQLCAELIFVKPRFGVYKEVSQHIRQIFDRYTDIIEPLSLDEAFLDVTDDKQQIGSAIEIAKRIKLAIREELQLTASAGVSVNKFVAKIASDINKPDGLTFIGPSSIEAFMEKLPVEKFFGVGKVTAERMRKMGLYTGSDIKKMKQEDLVAHFGKQGKFYFQIVRGRDDRQVQVNRETKSVGAEDTFQEDLETSEQMMIQLERIASMVGDRLQKRQLYGKTITLKIKYSDFRQITRSQSLTLAVNDVGRITEVIRNLLEAAFRPGDKVRLLGISLSNFEDPNVRNLKNGTNLTLFPLDY